MAEGFKLKLKLYRVAQEEDRVRTTVRMEASGMSEAHQKHQTTATWEVDWLGKETPLLGAVQVTDYEHAIYVGKTKTLFDDRTAAVLGKNPSYNEHFMRSTDYWRKRMSRDYGLDVVANHGLAIGDVNGDRLDDLYLCMQGGLPNRLFLRNPDGTLKDASEASGADWLDYCGGALFVDFDNDGDRDLIVGQEWRLLFMENDGKAHFELAFGLGTHAQTFSLAAADFDEDGDVDLFACGYNPSAGQIRQGALGEPMPYHDAQNGGRNMLLRNDGNWEFNDVTTSVGLDDGNNRFSFAASWDLDIYVANDYGRNNLYQNTNGKFSDVAATLGVEDMSAGMSVSWGDYNRDGWMDLYVSNMFSAAGNRITYQRQFQEGASDELRERFQRHARGNTLFQNNGKG
ncbi:MAG: FG-GAP repeat domain-containing protein, partial [Verrucomicrobiales bacterium]